MTEAPKPAPKRTALFTFGRGVAWILLRLICPVKYVNAERIQRDAPFIVISNHVSALDPVVIGFAIKRYETVFLGKKELTKSKFGGWVVRSLHMITVDRHNMDMEAMRACMRTVRGENVLGIFPEGTRHHEGTMEQIENGVSLIALRSGVPLMPVLIDGRTAPFRRVKVYCGEAIPTEDLREDGVNAQACAALNARITDTYRRMLKEIHG